MIRETPRNKDVKAQEHNQGIRVGSRWCSSLRVWGGGWVTMNSHGVEISIAGDVGEIVRVTTNVTAHSIKLIYTVSFHS